MIMRTKKLFLAVLLTAVCCTEVAAQGQRGMMKVDGITIVPVTNISLTNGPQLLSDNSVQFTVRAPEAQQVQVDLGGTKYDMTKDERGTWTVKTKPQVPGFHYYSLMVDGVSTADPPVSRSSDAAAGRAP